MLVPSGWKNRTCVPAWVVSVMDTAYEPAGFAALVGSVTT